MVTTGVEFLFDNVMYKQIDGVAMGSPLGPILANVFLGYCESLIPSVDYPSLYCRFVDDNFSHFPNPDEAEVFNSKLNSLHPALRFTCERESDGKIAFLDVCVERQSDAFVTSVYRKPTFTGMCFQYDAYCPEKYKVGLVRCLVNRAVRICSPSKLHAELEFLRSMFVKNGYPNRLLSKFISATPPPASKLSNETSRVFLRLPYVGQYSTYVERQVRAAVHSAYRNVHLITVFNTPRAFTIRKDVLPTHYLSHLIYTFECRQCDSRYVGKTLQYLNARVRQHVPLHLVSQEVRALRPARGRPRKDVSMRSGRPPDEEAKGTAVAPSKRSSQRLAQKKSSATACSASTPTTTTTNGKEYQSAVANHLSRNVDCAKVYSDDCFVPLSRGRSSFHLDVLESVYIKTLKPSLCTMKTHITPLQLFKSTLT